MDSNHFGGDYFSWAISLEMMLTKVNMTTAMHSDSIGSWIYFLEKLNTVIYAPVYDG